MRRVLTLALVAVALWGCEQSVLSPDSAAAPSARFAILDGAREGGNPDFHWQPPIVAVEYDPGREVAVDRLQLLRVEICEWERDACVGSPVRTFTADAAPPDQLSLSADGSFFVALWNADDDGLDKDAIYRISVKSGLIEFGYADVDPIREYHDLYSIDRDEFAVTADTYTMPIAFTIEEPAPPSERVSLSVASVGTGVDEGPQDGAFDFFAETNLWSVNDNGWTSYATAFEFALAGFPIGSTIEGAELTITLYNWEGTRGVGLYGFTGDGTVQLADLSDGLRLSTTSVDASGLHTLSFDATAFVSGLLEDGATFAGISVREEPSNTANFAIMELSGAAPPILAIDFRRKP